MWTHRSRRERALWRSAKCKAGEVSLVTATPPRWRGVADAELTAAIAELPPAPRREPGRRADAASWTMTPSNR